VEGAMSQHEAGQIVAFYKSEIPDSANRKIDDIWKMSLEELENTHNYIQWLFPLREKSSFNPSAPTLNNQVIEYIQKDKAIQEALLKSLTVMLNFYGLTLEHQNMVSGSAGSKTSANSGLSKQVKVKKASNFDTRRRVWLTPFNHNYLRISRIMTCLKTLGLNNECKALFDCLEDIYKENRQIVGQSTYTHWIRSALY
jgi:hypothetical protein